MNRKRSVNMLTYQIDITCSKLKGFTHPQYQILINDQLLNDYLNQHTQSRSFDLLLPPIDLINEQEQKTVLDRLDYRNVILPVLVCSDDMDFSCIVVSTYVKESNNLVVWDGFGYGLDMLEAIHVPKLAFEKAQYDRFEERFKEFILHPNSEVVKDI
jgi:hypothetical protein